MRNILTATLLLAMTLLPAGSFLRASEPAKTVFPDADKVVAQKVLTALWDEKVKAQNSNGKQATADLSRLVLSAAVKLSGTPYVAGTLDSDWQGEEVRIFLTKTDCILFVQTCLCLARTVQSADLASDVTVDSFANLMERCRYRSDGPPYSYSDRIHYTTEWLRREEGISLNDITLQLGGCVIEHPISYMSDNASRYPLLSDISVNPDCKADLKAVKAVEIALNREPMTTIPRDALPEAVKGIRSGDIICFTSTTEGLDISHVAIATVKNGQVFFIHASQKAGKVIVDQKPLIEYVNIHRNLSGVKVLRPTGR